jgi:hypothetical protein
LNVSGVPEPEEWMLLGLAAIALLFISRRQLKAEVSSMNDEIAS